MTDEDETPTRPELRLFACRACKDERGYPTGETILTEDMGEGRYRGVRAPCPWCRGTAYMDKATLMDWRRTTGRL